MWREEFLFTRPYLKASKFFKKHSFTRARSLFVVQSYITFVTDLIVKAQYCQIRNKKTKAKNEQDKADSPFTSLELAKKITPSPTWHN